MQGVKVRTAALLVVTAASLGCGSRAILSPSAAAPVSPSDVAFCASEINRYRTAIGRSQLTRSRPLEQNAAAAAEYDSAVRIPHAHFATSLRMPIVIAETEIMWWSGYDVRSVIEKGLAQMWANGPATGHYDVLAGAFTQVGCGIFVNGSEVTVVQDFR